MATRLANKTIWALEDMIAFSRTARSAWQATMERAERRMDPVMMVSLARLRDCIAEIERLARDARDGRYEQHQVVGGRKTDTSD